MKQQLEANLFKLRSIYNDPEKFIKNFFAKLNQKAEDIYSDQLKSHNSKFTYNKFILNETLQKESFNTSNLINKSSYSIKALHTIQNKLLEFNETSDDSELKFNQINQLMNEKLDEITQILLNNKTYILFNVKEFKNKIKIESKKESRINLDSFGQSDIFSNLSEDTFAKLVIVSNYYFNEKTIETFLNTKNSEKLDATNEILKLKVLEKHLESHLSSSQIDEIQFNLNEIIQIDLSYNSLLIVDSNLFQDFSNLTQIDLSFNYLETLPSELFSNLATKLTRIDLSYNQIKCLPFNLFKKLTKLSYLNLSSNQIEIFDVNLFNNLIELTELNLSKNKLISLDSNQFVNLNKLEFLNLNRNFLTQLNSKVFNRLANLKKIDLSYNLLNEIDSTLFANLTNLIEVNLLSNKIEKLSKLLGVKDSVKILLEERENNSLEISANQNENNFDQINILFKFNFEFKDI